MVDDVRQGEFAQGLAWLRASDSAEGQSGLAAVTPCLPARAVTMRARGIFLAATE